MHSTCQSPRHRLRILAREARYRTHTRGEKPVRGVKELCRYCRYADAFAKGRRFAQVPWSARRPTTLRAQVGRISSASSCLSAKRWLRKSAEISDRPNPLISEDDRCAVFRHFTRQTREHAGQRPPVLFLIGSEWTSALKEVIRACYSTRAKSGELHIVGE